MIYGETISLFVQWTGTCIMLPLCTKEVSFLSSLRWLRKSCPFFHHRQTTISICSDALSLRQYSWHYCHDLQTSLPVTPVSNIFKPDNLLWSTQHLSLSAFRQIHYCTFDSITQRTCWSEDHCSEIQAAHQLWFSLWLLSVFRSFCSN